MEYGRSRFTQRRDADELARARRRTDREFELAEKAGEAAAQAELNARHGPGFLREVGEQLAAAHRRSRQCHLAAARLHAAHAVRLRRRLKQPGSQHAPAFLAAVADVSEGNRVVLTLSGREHPEAVVAASDPIARAAHDLEATYGEGPATDAVARDSLVWVSGELSAVWPLYGPTVNSLGVHAVAAAPLRLHDHCLGSLTAFDPRPPGVAPGLRTDELADIVVHALLTDAATDDAVPPKMPVLDEADDQGLIHQAAGVVAAQTGIDIPAALALIRARAFADGESVTSIAAQVVNRRLRIVPDGR